MNTGSVHDRLLAEQRAYYSALAPEYLDQGLDLPGVAELTDALDAFRPAGSVLELACGPGVWTPQLLRQASDVTAVDASPEMLAIAATRVPARFPAPQKKNDPAVGVTVMSHPSSRSCLSRSAGSCGTFTIR